MLGEMRATRLARPDERSPLEPTDATAIVLHPRDRRIFLIRRSLSHAAWPGLWDTVGETVSESEAPVSSMLRAVRTALRARVLRFRFVRDCRFFDRCIRVYAVELSGEPSPPANAFAGYGWFSADEVRQLDFAMDGRQRVLDYFRGV